MSSCEDYISRFKRTISAIKHQQVLSSREKKKSELSIQAMAQKVVNVTNYLEPFVNNTNKYYLLVRKKKSELSIQAMAQKVVNVTNYLEPFVNRLSSNAIDQKLVRNLVGK